MDQHENDHQSTERLEGAVRADIAGDHSTGHAGQPVHWVVVIVMVIGSAVGGVGLVAGSWPMFWIGVAIAGAGGIGALATDIFGDVVLDEPRQVPELAHTRRGRTTRFRTGGPGVAARVEPDGTRRDHYVENVDDLERGAQADA